ncbi:MAG: OmpA family protein [Deltaproteobacteria bacterium]|nr:OmpA family protein [Deltaproteobacteria bacterium]MBI2181378.1 OmpA family protein [Deltaproteobacteria bacterium]MBI2533859.1 OmpA family protein [Deltaproteobacteria bacterium]MBI3064170.1 OmpA family protein [Deltaproteobacteria bacterium]
MKTSRIMILLVALFFTLGLKPSFAVSDEYDDSQSHPLRIAAYLAYPAAFLTEWIIFRPFHFLVSATEQQEAFFGHRPHPPVISEPQPFYDYGVAKKIPAGRMQLQPAPPAIKPTAAREPVAERVTIVQVPVEKIVVREVPKVVEVERIVFPAVAFRFDSTELTELGKGQAYMAAQKLKDKSDITVVIEGHADSIGSDDYNRKLGMRRAQTVMKELAAQGVEPERMSAASFGESKPLLGQETDWARAVNRRVEFQVKAR